MSGIAPEEDDDFITEDPLEHREIEAELRPFLSRSDRRRLIKALYQAGLVVFRG